MAAWKLQAAIGRGSYGEVYLAGTEDGQVAAVKVLAFQSEASNFQRRLQLLERELEILRALPPHPNLIRYLTARCRGPRVFIFMEYCDGGTLRDLYLQRRIGLSLHEGQRYTHSIVSGLKHLHARQIAHRDLKCENVFLTQAGIAKLGDFGASIILSDALRSSFIGSIHWMAPEVVQRAGHQCTADIWSLGCTVMEMFTATHPFQQFPAMKDIIAFLASASPVTFPSASIPPLATGFIKTCLTRTPEHRPQCCALLEHEFLQGSPKAADTDPPFHLSFQSSVAGDGSHRVGADHLAKVCAELNSP